MLKTFLQKVVFVGCAIALSSGMASGQQGPLSQPQAKATSSPIQADVGNGATSSENDKTKHHPALFPICQRVGACGFIDRAGKVVIPPQFDSAPSHFHDGLTPVKARDKNGERWGFIDTTGAWVVPTKYEGATEFSEGLAGVKEGGKWGFIDTTGKPVIAIQYQDNPNRYRFREGLASVVVSGKVGFMDPNGKIAIEPKWGWASDFSEGLARVGHRPKGDGYIDKTGKVVVEPQFSFAGDFVEDLAPVRINDNDKFGFIDKAGKVVIPPQFDNAESFSEGLAIVETNKKFGFVNKAGTLVVTPQYSWVGHFYEGLAMVVVDSPESSSKDGKVRKVGYIDKTGKVVIEPQFQWSGGSHDSSRFNEGLAQVRLKGQIAYIDQTGKVVWQQDDIFAAIRADDLPTVQRLIEQNKNDINAPSKDGSTPLITAVSWEKEDVVGYLLSRQANLALENKYGQTALSMAFAKGNRRLIQMLLDQGASLKDAPEALLIAAAGSGMNDWVEKLLAQGQNVNGRRRFNGDKNDPVNAGWDMTALMNAAVASQLDTVKLLLSRGADANSTDNMGHNALWYLWNGAWDTDQKAQNREIANYLLLHGAKPSGLELEWAAKSGYVDVLRSLRAAGVNLNGRDKDGATAFMVALAFGQASAARFLADHGAKMVDVAPGTGFTTLMAAAGGGSIEWTRRILSHGGKVNAVAKMEEGEVTALVLAAAEGHLDIVTLLVKYGAKINALIHTGGQQATALLAAAGAGHKEVAAFLLAHGADTKGAEMFLQKMGLEP